MENINSKWKKTFTSDQRVENYNRIMKIGTPKRKERLKILKKFCPELNKSDSILELGIGQGFLTKEIQEKYPENEIVGIDGSQEMLAIAREYLSLDNVSLYHRDYSDSKWKRNVDNKKYSLVLSFDALHHLEHKRKKELYTELYDLIKEGGYILLTDHISSEFEGFQKIQFEIWAKRYQQNKEKYAGEELSFKEAKKELKNNLEKEGDNPSPVYTQAQWLEEIGFRSVDILYRYSCFAIWGAMK